MRSRSKLFAIGAIVALITTLGGIAAAVQVGGGTLGGFEIDGNFAVDTSGNRDWANTPKTPVTDDTADSGFTQGSKELKPSGWDCGTGGATPNKGNILRAYVGKQMTADGAFVDLGFVAENISGEGDVHLNFEFDQQGTAQSPGSFVPGACPIPRQGGDLLVTFDYPGGTTNPTVNLFKWQPAAHPDGNHDGDWIDQNLSSDDAKAAVNSDPVDDPSDGTIDAGRFGEATINLSAALPQNPDAPCAKFGYVNVRSRSSGESITSSLQDKLPTTKVDLSTCGSITLHKVDDHNPAQALPGAQFGLFKNSGATGTPVDTCPSLADGTCHFSNVAPGSYWVKEMSAPDGYTRDADIVAVPVGALEDVDVPIAFVDPRDVGSVRIFKDLRDDHGNPVTPTDLSSLNGAAFLLYKDANHDNAYQSGEAVKLWPQETATAACTISGGLGYCDIPSSGYAIPTGTYRVHETAAPADTGTGNDVGPVVVGKDARVEVHYTNTLSPLNITIDKSGKSNDTVAGATNAHVGDTVHYTFAVSTTGPALHDVTVAEVGTNRCDGAISGPVKTGGDQDAYLEPGEVWTYTCDHIVLVGDPDPLPNTAQVTGTDTFGRHVTDDDSYSLDILHPAITLDKKVEGADHKPIADALVTRSGTLVHYVVTIHNSGDTALSITSLNDSLKGTLTGAVCTPDPAAGLAMGATITCSYTSSPTADAHNVASVTGVDVLGGDRGTKTASDETFVDVIHPGIEITKTATSSLQPGNVDISTAHVGEEVVYHFAVHNTGDVALTDVSVDDVPLGHIGTIPSLALGATTTLTLAIPAPASDLSNTATACGDPGVGDDVCGTDTHILHIIHPAITVTKTATSTLQPGVNDVTQAHAGDPVVYHFAVRNSGDVPLTNVTVNDSVFGLIPGTIASLAVGATDTSLSKAISAPAADLFNTATACGNDPLGTPACATDDHLLDIINPGLDVTKSANVSSAHVGDTVIYSFAVFNNGDVTLTNISVDDNVLGHIGHIDSLAAGHTETLTKTVEITAGMLNEAGTAVDNTVTACGHDPVGTEKCDTDIHHLPVLHPAITIDKKVEGGDHKPVGDALLAHEGDALGYTVLITNTGDTPLQITALSDTLKSGLDDTCGKGIGDTLNAGESTTCTYTMTAGADDAHNVVSVTGVDEAGGPNGTKSASDETFVDVVHPGISIDKKVDAADHKPVTDALLAHQGNALDYTVEVHNTGDTPLLLSVLSDTLKDGVAATCGKGIGDTLAPDESTTCTYTTAAGADDAHNVVSVTGVDPAEGSVSASDETFVDVIHPAIAITKVANPTTVEPGQTTTYTYVVTNTGDVTLTDVAVTDDILGAIGTLASLAPGASTTFTKTMTVAADSPRTNVATATGVDPLQLKVTATATESISIVLPIPPQRRPVPHVTVTPPQKLPHTGFNLFLWIAIGLQLVAAGLVMMSVRRGWRSA